MSDGEEKTEVVLFNEGAAEEDDSPAVSPVEQQLDVAQEADARQGTPEPVTSESPEPLLPKKDDPLVVDNAAVVDMGDENSATVVVNFTQKEELPKDVEAGVQINGSKGKEKEEVYKEPVQERVLESVDQEKKEEKEQAKAAPIYKLFRYATLVDWLLMFFGTLAAVLHGGILPAFTVVFGDFITVFVDQAVTQGIMAIFPANNFTAFTCNSPFNATYYGSNVSTISFASTMGTNIIPCPYIIQSNTSYSNVIQSCFSPLYDCLSNDGFLGRVDILAFVFIGLGVGVFALGTIQITLFQAACERQVKKIRLAFYSAIMRQEIGWFDANPTGELASRLTDDVDKIHDGIGDKVSLFIQWVATFFGGFIVAFVRDWRLTLLLIAFAPLLIIAGFFMTKITTSFASQEQKQYASAGAVAEEVLFSIRTVVAFGGEGKEYDRYTEKLKEARNIGAKKGALVGLTVGFVFFLFFAIDGVAFWFGGFLITRDLLNAGNLFTVFFAVLIGAFALGQALPNAQNLLTAAGAAGAIFEIIDRNPLINPVSEEGEKPEKFEGTIQIKDATFAYPTRPDIKVMEDFSLDIEVGKTYALVGPSGCGKSTIIQLIQRFYDPLSGEVIVGGRDVRSLNTKWLRQHIGVVSQEPVLFDTTIAENIKYGKEGATEDEMLKAAKNANAHDFISKLPNGYNTLVGEAGTQLSGGQKQRIAIARALIRDPKILLLDEATSALDAESESIVQEALDSAREGRTTIIVAHRLSTIQNADVIASISNGRIVEMGTHSELMDKEGLYFELVTAQSYAVDGGGVADLVGSPIKRLFSNRGSHRGSRRKHTSGSESEGELQTQVSVKRQESALKKSKSEDGDVVVHKILTKKEKEELWDKEIPEASLLRVMKANSKEWWIIMFGVLTATLNAAVFPCFSLLFGELLRIFERPPDQILNAVHPYAALFIALGIISGTANFIKSLCFAVSGEFLTLRLRSSAFKAMLRQEISWFDEERNSTGALTTRLADDAAQVQGATGTRLGTLIETMLTMVIAIVIAFAYQWVLTFLILAVVPIMFIAGALEVKALTGHAAANKKALEASGKIAVDSISNIRTVATLTLEESFIKQYTFEVQRPFRKAMINSIVYGLTYAFSQAVVYFIYPLVFRFGAFQITLPTSNVAHTTFDRMIVVFFSLVFGAAGAGQAGAFAPNYTKAKLSASRIFHLLDRVPEIDTYSSEGEKLDKVKGEVSASEIFFNYPTRPDYPVLQGFSVSVKSGQTLALVGPSGCGKSTVVSLLERFYDPVTGAVTLDDMNINDLNISWLRSQIGIVSQEPILFDRTIADNIRYGANDREVSADEVIEAAKAANIHSFVESLPQAYNTNVGSKGTQLSGGQKQRIAIARALVRDPKILLLDEATSALDTESEKIVQEALDKAREGRTSIVIAHRLSTIYNADCIAVISGGKVIESGTHKELMEKRGLYYKLNRFQVIEEKTSAS